MAPEAKFLQILGLRGGDVHYAVVGRLDEAARDRNVPQGGVLHRIGADGDRSPGGRTDRQQMADYARQAAPSGLHSHRCWPVPRRCRRP